MDRETFTYLLILLVQMREESHGHNRGIKLTIGFFAGIEVEAASRHELKSPQVNRNLFIQANNT